MTQTAPAPAGSTQDDASKRLARRHKALEAIFGGKFLHTFLSPYMVIEDHVIECPVGIRFYKKDFNYLSKQLYLEYQYRSWRGFNPELLDKYATIITTKLARPPRYGMAVITRNAAQPTSKWTYGFAVRCPATAAPNVVSTEVTEP